MRFLWLKLADMACSALVGFLLSLTPLSCDLMGWRGAGGNGAADIGTNKLQRSIREKKS